MYEDKVITNFQGKKIPKEDREYKCLSFIMLDSVIKTNNKKYHPQTFIGGCKYQIKKNKKENNFINDDFDLNSSDNESDNGSDN